MNGARILLADRHGQFIPQLFVESFQVLGANPEDIKICQKGPDEEYYWDAWWEICQNGYFLENGHKWLLWQDGDLFAYCEELMSDEDFKNFFGEEREQ